MTNKVEQELLRLEQSERIVFDYAKKMLNSDLFPLDLLVIAVLDRSLHLIYGFTRLIRENNFIAAAHLVRCHLDNLLRFSAAWLVDDPHDFANSVLNGNKVESYKDSKGNSLKDWYLRNELNKEYSWVENVYKESSGFIHLSEKHFFSASKLKDREKREVEFRISKTDNYVPDSARVEAIYCMIEITKVILKFIEGWTWTKTHPNEKHEV